MKTLGRLGTNYKKKYFTAIKAFNHEYKSLAQAENSDHAGERILELQKKIKGIEFQYREKAKENEILRTTSLEGLELTNVY